MNRLFLALKVYLDNYEIIKSDFLNILTGKWTPEENLHITICLHPDGTKYECIAKIGEAQK